MIFIRKISKGHNSLNNVGGCWFSFSAHRQIMVYICTNFHENTLNGFRVMELTKKVLSHTPLVFQMRL